MPGPSLRPSALFLREAEEEEQQCAERDADHVRQHQANKSKSIKKQSMGLRDARGRRRRAKKRTQH